MTSRWRDPLTVVTAPTEVDARNVQDFWETLASACAHHMTVIVDMTSTKICGPDAVVALLMALRYTDAAGTDIRIAASSAAAEAIISSGLPRRSLAVFDTVAQAIEAPRRSIRRPRGLPTAAGQHARDAFVRRGQALRHMTCYKGVWTICADRTDPTDIPWEPNNCVCGCPGPWRHTCRV